MSPDRASMIGQLRAYLEVIDEHTEVLRCMHIDGMITGQHFDEEMALFAREREATEQLLEQLIANHNA